MLPGFERKLHIQAHDILGAQDTAIYEKTCVKHKSYVVLFSEEKFVTERTVVLSSDGKPVATVDGGIPNQLHIASIQVIDLPQGTISLKSQPGFTVLSSYELAP